MYSQDATVSHIINDYLEEERFLERKIKHCEERRFNINYHSNDQDHNCETETENPAGINVGERCGYSKCWSQLRNQRFLKDLEEAKARLRTIASFTPTDQELRVLAGAYRGLLGGVEKLSQPHE